MTLLSQDPVAPLDARPCRCDPLRVSSLASFRPVDDRFSLKGKVAVITGASSGLGVTFAEGLAGAGAAVVLAARREERLRDLCARLEERGARVLAVRCDVSVEADVAGLAKAALSRFGQVDVLVNNAGMATTIPALGDTVESFRRVIDVNLTGTFACSTAFAPSMIERGGGSIVNVASVMGLVGVGVIPQASYNASKGGVVMLTRELAAQWARLGVRVNALAPGYFPSEMTAGLDNEEGARFIRRRTPLGRAGDPDELVGPLLLLASDASKYMTGHVLVVDGGWTAI